MSDTLSAEHERLIANFARVVEQRDALLAACKCLMDVAEEGLRNRESDANDGVEDAQEDYETGLAAIAAARDAIAQCSGEEVLS